MREGKIVTNNLSSERSRGQQRPRAWLLILAILGTPVALLLSLPPWNMWPLAFVALVPFLALIRDQRFENRHIFWTGTLSGALYWAVLYHMFFANIPYPWLQITAWIVWPVAIAIYLLLALLFGLTWGVYPLLVRRLAEQAPRWPLLWFSAGWVVLELVRSGLNWQVTWGMALGYHLPPETLFGQWASVGSVSLVSFGLVFTNWLIADLQGLTSLQRTQILPRLQPIVFFGLIWGVSGWLLLGWLDRERSQAPLITGVAVQTSQAAKTDFLESFRYDRLLHDVQEQPLAEGTDQRLIVLPEVAYGIDPAQNQQMTSRPSQLVYADKGTFLAANGQKIRPNSTLVAGFVDTTDTQSWKNGAGVVSRDGPASLVYKTNLFPFGEYLPLRNLWPELVRRFYRYTPSPVRLAPTTPLGQISLLFCNELYLPTLAARDVSQGAGVLTMLSSNFDVGTPWYAAWQQRAAAYRAVETWRSVILATDQGRAAVISPRGDIQAEVVHRTSGTATAAIPHMFSQSPWVALQVFWKIIAAAVFMAIVSRLSLKKAAR